MQDTKSQNPLSAEEIALFDSLIAREKSAERILVPPRISTRMPIIAATRRELDGQATDDSGLQLNLTKETSARALRILTALFQACEARGYEIGVHVSFNGSRRQPRIRVEGHWIKLRLETRTQRVTHVLTKKEEEDRKRWGSSWAPKYDYVPTGRLFLVIDNFNYFEKKTFSDRKSGPLEDQLNEFMVTLLRFAMVLRAEQHRDEEREREREAARQAYLEDERLRKEIERQRAEERRRRRELIRSAANFRRANDLLAMIAAVRDRAAEQRASGDQVEEWIEWASSIAASLNPVQNILSTLRLTGINRSIDAVTEPTRDD